MGGNDLRNHGSNGLLTETWDVLLNGLMAAVSATRVMLVRVHGSSHTTSAHATLAHHVTSGVDLVLDKHQDLLDELNGVRAGKD